MKKYISPKSRITPPALIAAAALLLLTSRAFAVDYNWNGTANNGYWGDANNWSPFGVPNEGTNDIAILSSSGVTNLTIAGAGGSPASFFVTNLVINCTNELVSNLITIPAGQFLQTAYLFLGPADLDVLATTQVKVVGEGELRVQPGVQKSDEVIRIGRSLSGPGNLATLDLSGLSSFNVTNSGRFVIGDKSGAGLPGTILLATNSTLSTTEFDLGFDPQGLETMVLGTGTNRLQGTIRMCVGTAGMGTIKFQDADTNGVLIYRNRAGTGKGDIQMMQSNSQSLLDVTNVIDFRGHYADLNVRLFRQSALNALGANNGRLGIIDNRFYFDRGVFNADSILMGWAGQNATNVNLVSIGGGVVNVTAVNQFTSAAIGLSGLGPATLQIGGGSLTLSNGGIGKYTLVSTTNIATLILNSTNSADPAVLNMNSNYIGTATAPLDIVEFMAGTLKNLGEFNGGSNVVKTGSGILTLSGTNYYTGGTVVSGGTLIIDSEDALSDTTTNFTVAAGAVLDISALSAGTLTLPGGGTLGGSGTILGSVNLPSDSTLSPGDSTGTLTVTNTVSLNGTTLINLDRSIAPNSGRIAAAAITFGGELTVTNSGSSLLAGDSFQLFSGPTTGSFATVNLPTTDHTGATYTWTNRLTIDGTIRVLTSSAVGVNTNPTNITTSVSGNALTLSWPQSHVGWSLQVQTNSLAIGISTSWYTVSGSAATNQVIYTIDANQGTVFFRLVYP
jgi:autotransporter-associated beta strand protein